MLGWRGPCPTGARSSMFRCVLVLCVGVLDELRERGARARAPAINADGGGQRKDCAPSRASAGTLRPPPREPSVHTEPNTTHLCGPISGSASWPPARRCRRAPTRAATCARARRTTAPPLPGCASRLLLPGRGSALRPTCRMCVCCVCVCAPRVVAQKLLQASEIGWDVQHTASVYGRSSRLGRPERRCH